MPDLACEQARTAIATGEALSAREWAHVEGCDACLDAWLSHSLKAKPEVRIPGDFAARIAAALPERRSAAPVSPKRERHWGLITAVVLVSLGMLATAVSDPSGLNTRMGMVFLAIVVSEIAGIGLWLGSRADG